MNEIMEYKFGLKSVRVVVDDAGEPWWVAKDVCDALGLDNVTWALKSLDEDELSLVKLNSGGQLREMKTINEPGLYNLIHSSRKPEAKTFQRWVRHEVLPTIRRTGHYAHPAAIGQNSELYALVSEVVSRVVPAVVQQVMQVSIGAGKSKSGAKAIEGPVYSGNVGNFVHAKCRLSGHVVIKKETLYNSYRDYCQETDGLVEGYGTFFKFLYRLGLPIRHAKKRIGERDRYVIKGLVIDREAN